MKFLPVHFSSLLKSLWMAAHPSCASKTPPSFASSANLLRAYSALSSTSLMKLLSSIGVLEPHDYNIGDLTSAALYWPQYSELGSSASFQSTSRCAYLVHTLSACQHLVPWIFLLAIFPQDRSDSFFLPLLSKLYWTPWTCKDHGE